MRADGEKKRRAERRGWKNTESELVRRMSRRGEAEEEEDSESNRASKPGRCCSVRKKRGQIQRQSPSSPRETRETRQRERESESRGTVERKREPHGGGGGGGNGGHSSRGE